MIAEHITNTNVLTNVTSQVSETDVAISVRNVSKMYRIYNRPQDRLKQMIWRGQREFGQQFWALQDVSVDVKKGDSLGILGANGSGKSTLLQIIAGTLAPTSGEIHINGRVAALLELGSGFNPEFTGRENVFLSGAIWGIDQEEMEERFDEIAAFADIGAFIDQPVKLYSSGMFARLAFAVSVSVDPDILIVDEILSVGDIQFQQKCTSRLRQMKEQGLTLLYVSHSIDALKSVCNRGLFLNEGQCLYQGSAEQSADMYLNFVRDLMNQETRELHSQLISTPHQPTQPKGARRYGTGHVLIDQVRLTDERGVDKTAFMFGETIVLDVQYKGVIDIDHLSISFLVRDVTGVDLMGTMTFDEGIQLPHLKTGSKGRVIFSFMNCLHIGSYGISIAINRITHQDLSDNVLLDQIDAVAAFEVLTKLNRPVHYKFHNPVHITVS